MSTVSNGHMFHFLSAVYGGGGGGGGGVSSACHAQPLWTVSDSSGYMEGKKIKTFVHCDQVHYRHPLWTRTNIHSHNMGGTAGASNRTRTRGSLQDNHICMRIVAGARTHLMLP